MVPGGSVDQLVSSGFVETTWKTTRRRTEISVTQRYRPYRDAERERELLYDGPRYRSQTPSGALLIADPDVT